MTRYGHDELRATLGAGPLAFPVTHMAPDLAFDEPAYREHVAGLGRYPASGVFAAGGTGEFFSLTPTEVARVVRAAVSGTAAGAAPATPVIAPAGYGTALAAEMARDAEAAGADALFLLPPYLTEAGQDGLAAHVRAVCAATSLSVIVYHRANAAFTAPTVAALADDCPNLIGFKDGIGDIELMSRLYATVGDRLLYVGGLPTAEIYALPYLELGVTTYSSALFNFLPGFAVDFYNAVRARDRDTVYAKLNEFVLPYLDIRNRRPGYAVSIVKAGMTAIGSTAGPVRPPLTDLTGPELTELTELIEKVRR